MKVDALVADPRRAGSVRVMVGGRVGWTVPADVILDLRLSEGCLLSGEVLQRLEAGADEEGAFRAGLRSLERRAHARRELAHKLERKGHPEAAVAAAIKRLSALGLLDDVAFARDFVRTRSERGRGPMRLRHDLGALGVSREGIDAALGTLSDDADERLALPRAMLARRAEQMKSLPQETRRRRLSAFLARRGYQGDERKAMVRDALRGTT